MNEIERAIEDCKSKIEEYRSDYKCWVKECKIEETKLKALEKQLNNGWIPCSERLPEEKENPFTWDYYEYTVTICIQGRYDIRHCKFGRGKWWNGGSDMSNIVIAWQLLPERYKEVSE